MKRDDIIYKLNEVKDIFAKDGFIILGIFGSVAREEATKSSDIDILYDLDEEIFLKNYSGFKAFSKLKEIKERLSNIFNKDVDIADKTTLNSISKKYILKDLIYV